MNGLLLGFASEHPRINGFAIRRGRIGRTRTSRFGYASAPEATGLSAASPAASRS